MNRKFISCICFLFVLSTQAQSPISDVYNGLEGEVFTIQGIVTTPEFGTSENVQFFVQDESAGILVNYSDNPLC